MSDDSSVVGRAKWQELQKLTTNGFGTAAEEPECSLEASSPNFLGEREEY